ncbi:MAG: hypothetical protein AAFU64_06810 [Bacteroidota bacterium]
MTRISHFSLRRFFKNMLEAFQEYIPEKSPHFEREEGQEEMLVKEEKSRASFKVSVNDLKVISSALLHYKKFLMKRKDYHRAEAVNQVDERIYQLILFLEKQKQEKLNEKEEIAL